MDRNDFTVGWLCALDHELTASRAALDEEYPSLEDQPPQDHNRYTYGRIGKHNVVMTCLPAGKYGTVSAATVAKDMLRSFESIRFGLMVGIGGGVPSNSHDIRLGDVVVSQPTRDHGGVVEYDFGKVLPGGIFERRGSLDKPPPVLLGAMQDIKSNSDLRRSKMRKILDEMATKLPNQQFARPSTEDRLFETECQHALEEACDRCNLHKEIRRIARTDEFGQPDTTPAIHYGLIASGNKVIASAAERERLQQTGPVLCFEMEAAGLMDSFKCLVIRGICDYADSYKRDEWQRYAAVTAAAYARELLDSIPASNKRKRAPAQAVSESRYDLGINLGNACAIDEAWFVGRRPELDALHTFLSPARRQRSRSVAILAGLGGTGKSQTALKFAIDHQDQFSSIFWLDATSESSMKRGLVDISYHISELLGQTKEMRSESDEEAEILRARQWLSEPLNHRWLLVMDNYDDPDVPGLASSTGYDIRQFYPLRSQGSILITSRCSPTALGKVIPVKKLMAKEESLDILVKRSGRQDAASDPDARKLADRLDGLPLALATAGAYLREAPDTFTEYLSLYEQEWDSLGNLAESLPDYHGRSLYTTWNLSYAQILAKSPEAAQFLRLLAYFDPQDLWYELFAKSSNQAPSWLQDIVRSKITFNTAMKRLQEYSLIELNQKQQSYSLHACVHDWTLDCLNPQPLQELYAVAVGCVAGCCADEDDARYWEIDVRMEGHAARLSLNKFQDIELQDLEFESLVKMETICRVLRRRARYLEVEKLYDRSLKACEASLGLNHEFTLDRVLDLGDLYEEQGRLGEAEQTYNRLLNAREAILGLNHQSTLHTILCLGRLYRKQGRLDEAEQMLGRGLEGAGKIPGSDYVLTRFQINLASLYRKQGRQDEAESLYKRALKYYEDALRPNDQSVLHGIMNLASLYYDRGRLEEAESMFKRLEKGYEDVLPEHHWKLWFVRNSMAQIYESQGRLGEAEQMLQKTLSGHKDSLLQDNFFSICAVQHLGNVYVSQGRLAEAEAMYKRALLGRERIQSQDYDREWTVVLLEVLGALYHSQGRQEEAQKMFNRAARATT